MFTLKITHVRDNPETPFFGESSSVAADKIKAFNSLQQLAPGFVKVTKTFSEDNRTMISVHEWDTESDYLKFKTDNSALIQEIAILRKKYHKANKIKRTIKTL